MASKIDKNIDFICANLRQQCRIVQCRDIAQGTNPAEFLRHPILDLSGAVGKDLYLLGVMGLEHIFDEEADGVLTEVGGDVAEA